MTDAGRELLEGRAPASSQRFGKSERLTTRSEYLLVQQHGTRIHLRDLLVFVYPRPEGRRIGITASTKVGGAVERNRIKRLLREVWRRERDTLPEGYDIVFVAKRSATGLTYEELRRQLAELAQRLGRRETQRGHVHGPA
jgi:ribonuclease P protein component